MASNFAQQVLCAQQVCLGALEAAFGFLFALAVFQHARRLFDDCPSIFGSRIQHRIDLPLAHDHVLLPTDAGIRQQFLHVEQAARHAVDGVFTFSGAEEGAADSDFREVNRQEAR